MNKIGVVYFSGTGSTQKIAQAVEQGILQADGECLMVEICGDDIHQGRWENEAVASQLDGCDAIIFGTPTYMGGVSGQLKTFFDAMAPRWYTQAWNGKFAAGFTMSALASGDKLNCLQDIHTFAMQMGMIWIGTGTRLDQGLNPNGYYLGVGCSAQSPDQVQEVDLNTAYHLGQRVSEFTQRITVD